MSDSVNPALVGRIRIVSIAVSAVGLVGLVVSWLMNGHLPWSSYLIAFFFCWGLAGGAIALLLLHQLTAGAWGFVIQRPLEAAAKTMPLILLMFVPVIFGMHELYHWTHADAVAADPLLQHKAPYLNVPFFVIRAAIYFAVWIGLALILSKWSGRPSRLTKIAGVGLVVWAFTTTFAAFDWAMSIDPHWFSTIYGLKFIVGQALTALAFSIVALFVFRAGALGKIATTDRLHDLGKLLLAFVMLWGYIGLSQLIIIWYGNLPEEITWYVNRTTNGYEFVTVLVVLLQFVLPFFVLLSRHPKRRLGALTVIAGAILLVRLLDLFWLVMPGTLRPEASLQLGDVAAPMFLTGLWVVVFTFNLSRSELINHDDPRLEEAFSHGAH